MSIGDDESVASQNLAGKYRPHMERKKVRVAFGGAGLYPINETARTRLPSDAECDFCGPTIRRRY